MYSPLMYVEGFGYRILSGSGHATVMGGRHLVTHNHIDEALFSLLLDGDPDDLITVIIFESNGKVLLEVSAQTISVLVVDREASVFDFGEKDGLGLFDSLGQPSAQFIAQPFDSLQPGVEVAQIDWDGQTTHIDWVTIETITTISETPVITLANCIRHGASGGGLFWNGYHIGNNWSRSSECSQGLANGITPRSTVALNSTLVTGP